jgi:hypothetical protein
MRRAEVPYQPGHDLPAERVQEAERDPAASRVRLAGQALKRRRQDQERALRRLQEETAVPGQPD